MLSGSGSSPSKACLPFLPAKPLRKARRVRFALEGDDAAAAVAPPVLAAAPPLGPPLRRNLSSSSSEVDARPPSCRFYRKEMPEEGDLVVVYVDTVTQMGAYVRLLEYERREGMVLLSELTSRRIRSINKLIKEGDIEVVVVTKVDPHKGYLDLSKRRVDKEDRAACMQQFIKAKRVHAILRLCASRLGCTHMDLCLRVAWPLYETRSHPCDVFKEALQDDAALDVLPISLEEKEALLRCIRRRMTLQPVHARAEVDVSCYTEDGIDAVREALLAGLATCKNGSLFIQLIRPPSFVLKTTGKDAGETCRLLQRAMDAVEACITALGGECAVSMQPAVVSEDSGPKP